MTQLTTTKTVTEKQLKALREAGVKGGDAGQVRLCDRALAGEEQAIDLCVFVIQSNERSAALQASEPF